MMFAATLNEVCIPFNNTQRRQHRYDEPLGLLADKIKSFSGWADIEAGLKASGQAFEGLCPGTTSQPPIMPTPGIRGFAVNVLDPETGRAVDPAKFIRGVKEGHLDLIADTTILLSSALATEGVNSPLVESDRDFDTMILLNTIKMASSQATVITLAIEKSVKDGNSNTLKKMYEGSPTRVALISDYHAQAIAAKKQNRDLSATERNAFRDKIVGIMLNDPTVRMNIVKLIVPVATQEHMNKMAQDIEEGRPFTPVEKKDFDHEHIKSKLTRFPGNLAEHSDVKNYKTYWQQQRLAGQDPLTLGEEYLDGVIKDLKTNEEEIKQEIKNSEKQQGSHKPAPRP